MHICQDELVIVGWAVEHVLHLWAYATHAWHWLWHRDGGCRYEEIHDNDAAARSDTK